MRKPDWATIAGNVAAVGLGLLWLWGMALCTQHAVWSHQAVHQAWEAFR
jgi:hypothetical protein